MGAITDGTVLAVAADLVVRDFMCVRAGEQVVITADMATDPAAVTALAHAVRVQNARLTICTIPQLPFQGSLADPYIPEPVAAAVASCDVWFDLTFPYMGGSGAHQAAMSGNRARSLLVADLGAEGIARLFGKVDLDRLFALQTAFDRYIDDSKGAECRVTCAAGTDFTFRIAKPATRKLRHTDRPGTYTPPGSAVMYPESGSVKGDVVIQGAFHEYHTKLNQPIRMRIDGAIIEVAGGGSDRFVFERALNRAGGGKFGSVIHLSHGFHPAARFTGRSFIEDIRARGCDAIGLGIPWWEPGGGENHPDGVTLMQSMWIGGEEMVRDGRIVQPALARLESELEILHR
jgi:2,5-dihydroxypyridine 5,6-dioxygenase